LYRLRTIIDTLEDDEWMRSVLDWRVKEYKIDVVSDPMALFGDQIENMAKKKKAMDAQVPA